MDGVFACPSVCVPPTYLPSPCPPQDLVVDMSNFYAQYKHIQPYLQTTKPKP